MRHGRGTYEERAGMEFSSGAGAGIVGLSTSNLREKLVVAVVIS